MQRIPLPLASLLFSLVVFSCSALPSLAGPKTDVVVLKNGDKITGEVKGLELGRLKYSTDNIGTIYIEWEDIASLQASRIYEVELVNGDIFHGSIEPGTEPSTLKLLEGAESREIPFDQLARIVPVSQSWHEGIDGSLNLGVSYVHATELGQFSLNGSATQRHSQVEKEIGLAATYTREPEQDTSRYSAIFTRRRFMAHKKYWYVNVGVTHNSEIGLDARTALGGGIGVTFAQSFASKFMGFAGLSLNRENPSGDDSSATNLDAALGVIYRVATYDFPRTKINVGLTVYPGLSPTGRARGILDGSISREIFKDFTLGLTVYDDYDSDPSDPEAQTNDYGVTMTVGWEF